MRFGIIIDLMSEGTCIALVAILVIAGCNSSLQPVDTQEIEVIIDGGFVDGFEVIDATDDRRFNKECMTASECDDNDPCTRNSCLMPPGTGGEEVMGECSFETKEIVLEAFTIETTSDSLGVALGDGVVYVAEGEYGVEAWSISSLAEPQLQAYVETVGDALSVDAIPQGVIVSEGEFGMQILATGGLAQLFAQDAKHGILRRADVLNSVGVGQPYSVGAAYADGVVIMDLQNPAAPTRIADVDTQGRVVDASVHSGAYALLADSLGGVNILLLQGENGAEVTRRISSDGRVLSVDVLGDTGIVAEYGKGFGVLDLSDFREAERLARVPTSSPVVSVALLGENTGVVALEDGRVSIVDLRDPLNPVELTSWKASAGIVDMDLSGSRIAIALKTGGIAVLDSNCKASE